MGERHGDDSDANNADYSDDYSDYDYKHVNNSPDYNFDYRGNNSSDYSPDNRGDYCVDNCDNRVNCPDNCSDDCSYNSPDCSYNCPDRSYDCPDRPDNCSDSADDRPDSAYDRSYNCTDDERSDIADFHTDNRADDFEYESKHNSDDCFRCQHNFDELNDAGDVPHNRAVYSSDDCKHPADDSADSP